MAHQMNIIGPKISLHKAMDKIQLRYMAEQANSISTNIESHIHATESSAPVRRNPYKLDRPNKTFRAMKPSNPFQEKHWEEAIFQKWCEQEDGLSDDMPFRRIISYQVMLRDRNSGEVNRGWGEVDLIGASADRSPVVVELKSKTSEYLLRGIIEGLAYAIAIRKAWRDDQHRSIWNQRVGRDGDGPITSVPVVVAAPTYCWDCWIKCSQLRTAYQIPADALSAIAALCKEISGYGFPITFVSIHGGGMASTDAFPTIESARTISLTD